MVEESMDALALHSAAYHAEASRAGAAAPRGDRTSLPDAVTEQLNRHLYFSLWPAVNSAAGALIIASIASRVVPAVTVVAWLVVALSVSLARLVAYRAYRCLPPARRGDRGWSDLFVGLMAAHGLSFGAAGLVMFETDDLLTHLTVVMTVV